MPGVFPDYPAPVIRNTESGTEMTLMRWGMPPPLRTGGPPAPTSALAWLAKAREPLLGPVQQLRGIRSRAEPGDKEKGCCLFGPDEERPLAAFAGIWTTFKGDRGTKSKPVPGPHQVHGFLTTAPNAIVEPIHPRPCG